MNGQFCSGWDAKRIDGFCDRIAEDVWTRVVGAFSGDTSQPEHVSLSPVDPTADASSDPSPAHLIPASPQPPSRPARQPKTHAPTGWRFVAAGLVTVFGLTALTTPADEAVAWSILSPTVVVFWMWAVNPNFPKSLVWFLGFSTPLAVNLAEADTQIVMMIGVVTAAVIASEARRRATARNGILAYIFVIATLRVVGAIEPGFSWPMWVLALALGWAAGELLWRFGNTVDELEHTRALVADQGILQERRRIARDVHDLVGHSLSVVLLHVTGARHLVHTDPDEAERALLQAEEAGRQSLAEIRRTVGLLRDETDVGAPAVPSADLADVRQLCDDFTGAGLFVGIEVHGDLDQVDPAVGLAGYRIVQEALTNVSRHTVGAEANVTMTIDDQSCEITVTNRGGETIDLGRGSGFGLVSMRERAKSVGGSLIAGPTPEGWIVEASLPVESTQVRR